MGVATFYYSTEFASALLCATLFGILQSCTSCGLISYVFLALAAYQLYGLLSSKKLQGKMVMSVLKLLSKGSFTRTA